MKILVCGMTPQQSGRSPDIGYMTLTDCVIRLLTDIGHDVDVKVVAPEDDLTMYDLIIAGIASPFSVSGRHIYGTLSLLDRYWRDGKIPVMSLVDDWEMHQIDQNSRSAQRLPSRLVRPSVYAARPGYDWAMSTAGQQAITRVLARVTESGWPPAIFPAFGWGNHEVFKRLVTAESYWPIDLTCYTPQYPFTRTWPSERSREWVLAVIKEHGLWASGLGATWDLNIIGGGMTKRAGLIQESDVIREYARCWGVLSPSYKRLHGSGWWRNRFVYAAATRSVLYCDPREAPQLGEAYTFPIDIIEGFSNGQLLDLAEAQASSLRAGCWDGARLHAEGERMVTEVTA